MGGAAVDILMYHSISNDVGPTSITPQVFSNQMEMVAESGIQVISMDQFLVYSLNPNAHSDRAIVLTFDDGFQNFADTAFPILQRHKFRATVFLATDYVGQTDIWEQSNSSSKKILPWGVVRDLSRNGVVFGSHSVSHADLTLLKPNTLKVELKASKQEIECKIGKACKHFAFPYGRTNDEVNNMVSRYYTSSVGTRFDRTTVGSSVYNLPRLEMFYFNHLDRWRDYLGGRGAGYFAARQLLRKLRRRLTT
ncbi:polysaccharide deacetylase family protein [Pseudoruegeria sp. SK021]|uniref:polysaccharide deacetylase family protein n=1 Tax=Pseudoruegeria sp. SK021 TaxID=1933035 RepID=UPI000A261DB0|nr:polysaccharide deacetylase family protein [Pseudoruegeria sp. SK021]OSP55305.1 hypothetical protein BV911_07655 [Pseudoruegeria sp. SK021]